MFVLAHLSDPHLPPLPAPRCSELISKRFGGFVHWQRKRRDIHHLETLERMIAHVKDQKPDHIALTRAEPGCLAFEVKPAPGLPGRLVVSERFQSRADFEAHQARIKGSHWAAVTRGIARHYKVSEVPA